MGNSFILWPPQLGITYISSNCACKRISYFLCSSLTSYFSLDSQKSQVVLLTVFLGISLARSSSSSLDIFLIFHINSGSSFVRFSATIYGSFFFQCPVPFPPLFFQLSLMASFSLCRHLLTLSLKPFEVSLTVLETLAAYTCCLIPKSLPQF